MTDYRIVYPTDNGIAIIAPVTGVPQEIILTAVPAGTPYKIIDVVDIPEDDTFRDAWEVDFSEQDQVEGGE